MMQSLQTIPTCRPRTYLIANMTTRCSRGVARCSTQHKPTWPCNSRIVVASQKYFLTFLYLLLTLWAAAAVLLHRLWISCQRQPWLCQNHYTGVNNVSRATVLKSALTALRFHQYNSTRCMHDSINPHKSKTKSWVPKRLSPWLTSAIANQCQLGRTIASRGTRARAQFTLWGRECQREDH